MCWHLFLDAFFFPSLRHINKNRPGRVIIKRGEHNILDLLLEGESPFFAPSKPQAIQESDLEDFILKMKVNRLVGAVVRSQSIFPEASSNLKKLAERFGHQTENLTILRPPLERAESEYYYLRDMGIWEKTFGMVKAGSFNEHILTGGCGTNWLVKKLTGKVGADNLEEMDLEQARAFLSSFSLIGTTEKVESFLAAAKKRYRIEKNPANLKHLINNKRIENKNLISKKEAVSVEAIQHYRMLNTLDVALYDDLFLPGVSLIESKNR